MRTYIGKRFLDLLIAVPAAIVLSPVIALTYILVRITSPGPAIFVQERIGYNAQTFQLYKFRTMTHRPRVAEQEIALDNPEITSVGYWLRRFKIDELLQIVNVLKGDMSIVGPRPDLPSHLPNYDEVGRQRLLARPGLTGLAQVHGNIYLSWPERWRYDAIYVNTVSLWLDLWVIYRTIMVVLRGEDRYVTKPQSTTDLEVRKISTDNSVARRRVR